MKKRPGMAHLKKIPLRTKSVFAVIITFVTILDQKLVQIST